MRTTRLFLPVIFALFLASCSSLSTIDYAERYDQIEPLDAVLELRDEVKASPGDVSLKSLLVQYEANAAEFYYQQGAEQLDRGQYALAIEEFNRGLTAAPDHDKLLQSISSALLKQHEHQQIREAQSQYRVGNLQEAKAILLRLMQATDLGAQDQTSAFLAKVNNELDSQYNELDVFSDPQKITLNFQNTQIKAAFGFLSKAFDINIVFDESVKDQVITLHAKNVSFKQALSLLLTSSKMFHQKVGNKTILIAADTTAKRNQYEELLIRTFQLRTMPAKEMADIVKGVLQVNKMVVNEQLNTLIVRDSQQLIDLVDKMIEVNDRRPAELLLEVEILEVNRNKAEQLGIDYGSVITSVAEDSPLNLTKILGALEAGTVTLPNVTFRYFKQDVDAETLANPKIRVINQKQANIHIGDRVPLRASTIQNANGQTQTSYEYSDIGIRLDVTPTIHFDDTISVQLTLEVSSLGQNLGSPEEPTYSIGTRNTSTFMLLKDGETAMIGGLIREEERSNTVKLPGLGSIPVIGRLFQTRDDSIGRTDVLLTITPKIVRRWDAAPKQLQTIYSGTADHYSTTPAFPEDSMDAVSELELPLVDSSKRIAQSSIAGNAKLPGEAVNKYVSKMPVFSFSKSVYSQQADSPFEVVTQLNGASAVRKLQLPVVFNNTIIKLVDVRALHPSILDFSFERTDRGAEVLVQLSEDVSLELQNLFLMDFDAISRGISYLNVEKPTALDSNDQKLALEVSASRVVIQ